MSAEKNLQDIINYAIGKEQDAIDFYTEVAEKVKVKTVAEELLKIKAMEEGHKKKLENIDLEKFVASTRKDRDIMDLKIADYVQKDTVTPDMTWQDVLNIAMHREFDAMKLYQNLAQSTSDPAVSELFEQLALDEKEHKLFFEKKWDDDILTEN